MAVKGRNFIFALTECVRIECERFHGGDFAVSVRGEAQLSPAQKRSMEDRYGSGLLRHERRVHFFVNDVWWGSYPLDDHVNCDIEDGQGPVKALVNDAVAAYINPRGEGAALRGRVEKCIAGKGAWP